MSVKLSDAGPWRRPQDAPRTISDETAQLIDGWWRAANYLSVGQIYLLDNPLLRRPLTADDVKHRLLGHWGTTPGLNFLYAHFNRAIIERDLHSIYIAGPGHGEGLGEQVAEVVDEHALGPQDRGEGVVLRLGAVDVEGVVEEERVRVDRGEARDLAAGAVDDDLPETSGLGVDPASAAGGGDERALAGGLERGGGRGMVGRCGHGPQGSQGVGRSRRGCVPRSPPPGPVRAGQPLAARRAGPGSGPGWCGSPDPPAARSARGPSGSRSPTLAP